MVKLNEHYTNTLHMVNQHELPIQFNFTTTKY